MLHKISGKQVKEIINLYSINNSILETAKATGISTVKVRKVLITEGLWESDTSIKIRYLLEQGLTTKEIAEKLCMSIKNVQAYMPYERGIYNGENVTLEAARAVKYRNRMKKAAAMQVVKRKLQEDEYERGKEMKDEKVILLKDKTNYDKPDVLKLHLELDMKYINEEGRKLLKKYGSMKNSISRDILVPSDITLHALHYAILRMFGWQNGHLHNFSLPEDVYKELTENKFCTWTKMAGFYFRFPTEDYEDIYWDDNYREGESIKSWMKRKYTGPYKYRGYSEHYLNNQMEVERMLARWDEITVHEFIFRAERQRAPYNIKLKEATIDQVMRAFLEFRCDELIERLPLMDVLCIPNTKKKDSKRIRKYIDRETSKFDINNAFEQYRNTRFNSMKQEREYLEQYNIRTIPITDMLHYSYDYGDGWKVLISCEMAYSVDEKGVWTDTEEKVSECLADDLEMVVKKHRPICIEKDGIELVDDIGGIGGFCEMLKTIYEADIYDEEAMEERDNMLGWAGMMGWTGRNISPKQTL